MNSLANIGYCLLVLLLLGACQTNDRQTTNAAAAPTLLQNDQERISDRPLQADESGLQNGDLIFHRSQSEQSQAIQLVTKSPYSHVGILYKDKEQWYVFEAISTVQRTRLERWIARGKNKHYVVKRLKDTSPLTVNNLKKMKAVGRKFQGKRYDLKFEWSDDRLYCSELVWKIYDQALGIELSELQQLKDFDVSHPLVQEKIKQRYGHTLPLTQWVVSPAQLFNSEKLETVLEEGKAF